MRKRTLVARSAIVGALFVAAASSAHATPQPVGWWRFDETSGTVAHDSSGGDDGTIEGATLGVPGKVGTAFAFDGAPTTDVRIPTTPALRPAQVTISLWIQPQACATTCGIVSNEPGDSEHYGYGLRLFHNQVQWCGDGGIGYGTCIYSPEDAAPVGVWTQITVWSDGSTEAMLINGTEVASGATDGVPYDTTDPLLVGNMNGGLWAYSGVVDDIRIYDSVVPHPPDDSAAVLATATHVGVCTPAPEPRADGTTGRFFDVPVDQWLAEANDPSSILDGSTPAVYVAGYGLMCELSDVVTYGGDPGAYALASYLVDDSGNPEPGAIYPYYATR